MKRGIKTACFVLALLAITIVSLPLRSLNILASDTSLMHVTVVMDITQTNEYKTGAKTVEAFFKEQNIRLGAKDQCDYDLQDNISDGMVITVRRGVNVNIEIDGIKEKRRTGPDTTVEQLMALLQDEYGVALLYDGDLTELLKEDDNLKFTTWYSEIVTVTQDIPFDTEEIETTAVREGKSKVRQDGITGEKQISIAVIYIGGAEQKREVIEEVLLKEPVIQIVDKGIGGSLGTTTDTSSPSFEYIQKLTLNASAYTAGYESTGKNPGDRGYGVTFTGEPVRRGIVSVDPRVIPLGSRLYVEGYGYSLAADTGSGIIGNMIDLFYESLEDALRFGRRNLDVYILE